MSQGVNSGEGSRPRLVLATHNVGKVRETRQLLQEHLPAEYQGNLDTAVVGANQIGAPDVVEDGTSFEENALLKARAVAQYARVPVIADDSGLAVEVMGGSPGIFSARWSGRHGDDQANLDLLLAQISDVPDEHRGAKFVCVAVLAFPDGRFTSVRGEMEGSLVREARGQGGFGYDPIFVPSGLSETAAQLSAEEKNRISHRGKAMRALLPKVLEVL